MMSTLSAGGGTPKAVTIVAEPESISPLLEPIGEEGGSGSSFVPPQPHSPKQQRRASMAKRLSGRASITTSSSLQSLSYFNLPDCAVDGGELSTDPHSRLVAQLLTWLNDEKTRRRLITPSSTSTEHATASSSCHSNRQAVTSDIEPISSDITSSDPDSTEPSLQKLEQIISDSIDYAQKMASVSTADYPHLPNNGYTQLPQRRKSSIRRLRKASIIGPSSDTEYQDGDAIVPSADVVLDNSKTLSYCGGEADAAEPESPLTKRATMEKDGWASFKYEIVRLAHTLRLRGWRRVSLDQSLEIGVSRLSGALTNAVYVVSPPTNIKAPNSEPDGPPLPKKPPPKLLLRIYGPFVDHLIDRASELQILRRLARKNIGPRLLGTFENGRFEEYFNATTLTPSDLRNPETSKQIAKRMRELHDGIELLPSERDAGPFVWQNWDKWVTRCEGIITWLDEQVVEFEESGEGDDGTQLRNSEKYKTRGFVCGVEWAKFRQAVDRYRVWLDEQYGGKRGTRSQLVFAHNDTQYGNLLRINPSGTSPLLLPANEHKQLVVIDFEYANANTPGLEFANHFTEWCYNYHSPTISWLCNTQLYPSPEEQRRFIKAYVQHVPGYNIKTPTESAPPPPSSTSASIKSPGNASSSSISAFMLDSRAPPNSAGSSSATTTKDHTLPSTDYEREERARDEKFQRDVERWIHEARLWRIANSTQWVAWGIVQATVPGMQQALAERKRARRGLRAGVKSFVRNAVHGHVHSQHPRAEDIEGAQEDTEDAPAANGHAVEPATQDEQEQEPDEDADVSLDPEVDDDEDFDYLAYAQDRAMFFWGDMLEMGLVEEKDLPELVRCRAKRLPY